jgi:branched-subunit amino acid transport protein AzlD
MNSSNEAIVLVLAMGAVILFCRAFPFLFFGKGNEKNSRAPRREKILNFVEQTVPPAAMTVLAFNALGGAFRDNLSEGIPVLIASAFTAVLHLWKRNSLVSIIAGTALYMALAGLKH